MTRICFPTKTVSLLLLLLLIPVSAWAGGNGDFRKNPRPIPDQYIVVLDHTVPNVPAAATELARANGIFLEQTYERALKGFSAVMSEAQALALSHHKLVNWVEEDGVVEISATQTGATWGLDRIDQRDLPLNSTYTYDFTGAGVRAYIIDTGIRASHSDFGGRVVAGYTAINDGRGTDDCNGHGTHVSGTVGGTVYGVAKSVTLVPVRVLDCNGSGSTSGVIAGVDWVASNHAAGTPAAANMSLGGGISSALDTAVNNSINDGVTYAIAAGNSNANACNYSPARVAAAITVGATTSSDARSSFSNYGTCVDIFAPGSSITSDWNTSDSATNTISGTSMATPHVAGVAALYLQSNPAASPSTVWAAIRDSSTPNKVTNPGSGSPNRLLYSLLSAPPPSPTPTPTPTPPPPGNELVVNGGFEGSASPWVLSGNAYFSTGGYPHSGTGYTVLGYYNNASGSEYQQISVPSGGSPSLTFWLNVTSSETTTTTVYDRLFVEVRNSSGTLLATLATYSNLNKGTLGVYSQKGAFSLASWAGQTIRIQFRATTDFSLPTSFRIDDVSVK